MESSIHVCLQAQHERIIINHKLLQELNLRQPRRTPITS